MSSSSAISSPAPLATVSLGSSVGVAWTVEPTSELPPEWAGISSQPCPATVPGEVHVDLMNAGLIPDPFDGDSESLLAWIGRTDWIYQAAFDWVDSGHTRTDLVVEGLDTVARIVFNGREVARTENQHRSYRFDVSELLVAGHNQLQVAFAAPVIEADRRSAEIGHRPGSRRRDQAWAKHRGAFRRRPGRPGLVADRVRRAGALRRGSGFGDRCPVN